MRVAHSEDWPMTPGVRASWTAERTTMPRWAAYFLIPFLVLALGGQAGVTGLVLHEPATSHAPNPRYGPICLKNQQEVRRLLNQKGAVRSSTSGVAPSVG